MYHSHSVVFESIRQRGMYVHTSAVPYDSLPSSSDASLPRRLRTGITYESNVSPQKSTYELHKYGRFDEEVSQLLSAKLLLAVRLYHGRFCGLFCGVHSDLCPYGITWPFALDL